MLKVTCSEKGGTNSNKYRKKKKKNFDNIYLNIFIFKLGEFKKFGTKYSTTL